MDYQLSAEPTPEYTEANRRAVEFMQARPDLKHLDVVSGCIMQTGLIELILEARQWGKEGRDGDTGS